MRTAVNTKAPEGQACKVSIALRSSFKPSVQDSWDGVTEPFQRVANWEIQHLIIYDGKWVYFNDSDFLVGWLIPYRLDVHPL